MKAPSPLRVLTAIIAVQVLFGINYLVSKSVITHFPPLVWGFIRVVVAGSVIGLIALLTRRPHPVLNWPFVSGVLVFGFLGMILNQATFLMGLSLTTPTNSAVLNTLIPVFTLAIVTLRGQETLTPARFAGFVLALVGVLALRRIEDFQIGDATLVGDLLTVINCVSYALFLSFAKPFLERHDPVWTTFYLFVWGAIGAGLLSIPQWQGFVMPELTPSLRLAGLYSILGATLVTYFLNFWSLKHAKSSQVALLIYLQPIVTSAVQYFYLGESVTLRSFMSTALIFAGMVLALGRTGTVAQEVRVAPR